MAKKLKANEALNEILKKRRQLGSFDQTDTKDLIKSITKDSPLDNELRKLFHDALKLDNWKDKQKQKPNAGNRRDQQKKEPFSANRFPTKFTLKMPENGGIKAVNIPRGTEKRLLFDTDIEDNYLDQD